MLPSLAQARGVSCSSAHGHSLLKPRKKISRESVLVHPDRLTGKAKPPMLKRLPASPPRKFMHFAKGKRACCGKSRIDARHLFAKNQCGEEINADRRQQTATEIGNENAAAPR